MASALIGYTGYVGSTLLAQRPFDHLYRSTNIGEIEGRDFDLLVCAGAPAAKWKANREPEADLANIQRLTDALSSVKARRMVLISTVDVYPKPVDVDEETSIDPTDAQAYGRNRYLLERFVVDRFPGSSVVRLPGLFGRGLRKNFIFDLIGNPDALRLTHAGSRFQFYDMSRLWADLTIVTEAGVPLINFATEPVSASDVARQAFGVEFRNETEAPPVSYDMRTRHAALFGVEGPWMMRSAEVLTRIQQFAEGEKAANA